MGPTIMGKYSQITELSPRDVMWLQRLADGVRLSDLPARSEQVAKNRVMRIRWFLQAETTTQAVAIALRRGIIR